MNIDELKFFADLAYRLDCYKNKVYPEIVVDRGEIIPKSDTTLMVVIPTYGREDKQKVYYQFPKHLRETVVYLATKEERYDLLKKNNPDAKIIKLPESVHGIAATRQACIEHLPKGKVWMLDDQVKLQLKGTDLRVVGQCSPDEVEQLYHLIDYLLDYYIQVGVSGRPGNDKYTVWLRENVRIYTCYGLRTDIMEENNFRFTGLYEKDPEMIFMEDFYLNLSMLTSGFPNVCIWDFVADHHHNKPGGNSLFRKEEINTKCWKELKRLFPDYIKLKKVNRTSWGKGMQGERTEGTIYWKNAFKEAVQKNPKVKTRSLF